MLMVSGLSILCFNKTHFFETLQSEGHRLIMAGVPEEQAPNRLDAWSQKSVDLLFNTGDSLESVLARLPSGFTPDRIVYFDDSNPIFRVRGLERSPVPTLFYSVDAHIHRVAHPAMSGIFDQVLVAQKDYVEGFKNYTANAQWFPLWAPEILEPSSTKKFEACFRGSLNPATRKARLEFLQKLAALVPLDFASGSYEEAFPFAKIIVNEAINDDVNFRVFESLVSGGMLLTPITANGLSDLFQDGTHLVTYRAGDYLEAAEKIKYYLAHDEKREAIAQCGRNEVLQCHSEQVRAREFAGILRDLQKSARTSCFFAAAYRELFELRFLPALTRDILVQRAQQTYALLNQCVTKHETFHEEFIYLLLLCRKILGSSVVIDLLQQAAALYSDQAVLKIILIDSYLKVNQFEQAQVFAQKISADADEILRQAPLLVQKLEESSFFDGKCEVPYLNLLVPE